MRRRKLLRGSLLALVSASSGCLVFQSGGSSTPASDTPQPPTDTPRLTPPPDDPIQFVFADGVDQTATVQVSRGDETILDVTKTIPSAYHTLDSGIRTTGAYDLSVAFEDGPASTFEWDVSEYDIRMGSNVYLSILDDEVGFSMEQ